MSCVIVKGGPGANVYCYDTPVYGDTKMVAPLNDKTPEPDDTYAISHATFCYNEPEMCYEEETAWAEGTRYVKRGNWAMYVAYGRVEKTVELIADYTNYVHAGTVTFSAPVNSKVTITVTLTGGAIFYYDLTTRCTTTTSKSRATPKHQPRRQALVYLLIRLESSLAARRAASLSR